MYVYPNSTSPNGPVLGVTTILQLTEYAKAEYADKFHLYPIFKSFHRY